MAEQQTQNTAIVGEKKVPPTDEVEEGPESKVESPVPPVEKASTPGADRVTRSGGSNDRSTHNS